jgi:two-component system CheB/CheR fusion protein
MNGKVNELAHANSDLQNLMASTAIATVFLDRELKVTRYTPSAAEIFNLIPSDAGRPLAHLKHRVDYPDLITDIEQVSRTLIPVEREVRADSRWYFSRIQPYRTLEDRIGGTVITFVDITERNRATEALRASEERLRLLIESAKEYAIFTTDPERHVNSWNSGARALFGYADTEILGHLADELFTPEDQAAGDAVRELDRARDRGFAENERWHARKDGSRFYGSGLVMPLRHSNGELRGFVKIMRDLTESKKNEEVLRENVDELVRFNAAAVGRELRMIELKNEINSLSALAGEAPRYSIDFDQQEADPAGE